MTSSITPQPNCPTGVPELAVGRENMRTRAMKILKSTKVSAAFVCLTSVNAASAWRRSHGLGVAPVELKPRQSSEHLSLETLPEGDAQFLPLTAPASTSPHHPPRREEERRIQ